MEETNIIEELSKIEAQQFSSAEEFNKMLDRIVTICEDDHKKSKQILELFMSQLKNVHSMMDYSEEGILEKAVNEANKNLLKSTERLNDVLRIISKIRVSEIFSESRERIVDKMTGQFGNGEKLINGPVDFKQLLDSR